mgnify:CR=1 FL=1
MVRPVGSPAASRRARSAPLLGDLARAALPRLPRWQVYALRGEFLLRCASEDGLADDFVAFLALIRRGHVSPRIRRLLLSSRGVGVPKPPPKGGVRPLAVGSTLLRFVHRVENISVPVCLSITTTCNM